MLAADLGNEYFRYDEKARTLVGDESGETYRVGQRLELGWPRPIRSRAGCASSFRRAATAARRARAATGSAAAQSRRHRVAAGPANIRHQGKRR